MKIDRAFVPLTEENFNDFDNGKDFELRKAERGWTPKNIRTGRRVTVSCGYGTKRRIEGRIGQVIVGTLEEIFEKVAFKRIEPRARDRHHARLMNIEILGNASQYIAFEIKRIDQNKKRRSR